MDVPPSTITRSDSIALEREAMQQAFMAREPWAFESAYNTFRRLLYAAAYSVLRDAGEAEDCVHDVLLRLWQRGHAYTPARGSLGAFLTVCVRNEALTRRRKFGTRERIERDKVPAAQAEPAFDEAFGQSEAIASALRGLSEKQRDAIDLAYYQGLTHEEIARRLNEPLGTVKSRLFAAVRALRELLV